MRALSAGIVLICALYAPVASAGLVDEAGKTVGSAVQETAQSVQDTVNVPPPPPPPSPLPSASTPPKPPQPPSAAAVPDPPPQAPVKLPSKSSPDSSSRTGEDPADPPSTDGLGGAVQRTVDSVTRSGSEGASGATTTSPRSDGGAAAAAAPQRADRGASGAIVRRSKTASSPPAAVRAAEVAAVQRWLARVWPAISLGGFSGAGVLEVITGDLLRPAVAAITGVLLASSPILPESGDLLAASGDAPLVEQPGVAGASPSAPAPPPAPAAAEGGGIVYLIAIAALLALLAFTVWREFRIAMHPRLR